MKFWIDFGLDFEANLGSSWDVLGRLGSLLACLGRVLGVSWRCLFGGLGASWLLGLPWERLGSILERFWEGFGVVLVLSQHCFFLTFVMNFNLALSVPPFRQGITRLGP